MTIPDWYGQRDRKVEIVSSTAVWYHSGKPAVPIRWVLIRDPLGSFRTQAVLCTDLEVNPIQILLWFIYRWLVEVTFHEVRDHLGMETQRQWSDKAIARITPALLSLFSLVTLLAHQSARHKILPIRQAAWYAKSTPPFRMPWLPYDNKFGKLNIFLYRPHRAMFKKSHSRISNPGSTLCVIHLEPV